MSFWSVVSNKLKEIFSKMAGSNNIEKELNFTPLISQPMEEAIHMWSSMYKGQAPWLHNPTTEDPVKVVSLGLPALIASEKARTVLIEFNSEITTPMEEVESPNPDYVEPDINNIAYPLTPIQPETIIKEVPKSDTTRAEFLNLQYKKLKKNLRTQLEYGIAKGGFVIKPYVVLQEDTTGEIKLGSNQVVPSGCIEFEFIQADRFYPLTFDVGGRITEAAFIEIHVEKDVIYRRLEYHEWKNNTLTVLNRAYKSNNVLAKDPDDVIDIKNLGKEVNLSEIPEWASLQRETTIKNVNRPLFAYFKMPEANTVDTTSPLGVSGFDRAKKLIKEADLQYSRLLWEYEAGEMAIDIDRDALREDTDRNTGNSLTSRPYLQQRLMRKVDLGSSGDTYNPYNPSLRDMSYINGLNTLLMRIEDVCAMSRGTLSDPASEARTATELKILKQRSYQANLDIQNALEDTLRDVIYIMDVLCTLYNLVGDITMVNGIPDASNKGQWDVSFEWDDSILTDIDTELNKQITLLHEGITSKKQVRMWYYGETQRQAEKALAEIENENMQNMQDNMMMQMSMAGAENNE